MKKVLKKIAGILCLIECIVGTGMMFSIDLPSKWPMVATIAIFAFLAYLCLKKPKRNSNTDAQIASSDTSSMGNTSGNNNLEVSDSYVNVGNTLYRTDGREISDEEIPFLIQSTHNEVQGAEKEIQNPSFHRTAREEELSLNFMMKYGGEAETYADKFDSLYRAAYQTDDLNKRIELLKDSAAAYEKAKRFCYSKGKGGTIYFQDMWEYMFSSRNDCFSYMDNIQNSLDEAITERDVIIPGILNIITENDGVLQKNVYALLPDIDKASIQRTIRKLADSNKISRTKKSNSYELRIIT